MSKNFMLKAGAIQNVIWHLLQASESNSPIFWTSENNFLMLQRPENVLIGKNTYTAKCIIT